MSILYNMPDDPNKPDGPTIKEANMARTHNIPLNTLVEVKYNRWFGDGACIKTHARLWVVGHFRDCDGTPLYQLSDRDTKWFEYFKADGCHSKMRMVSNILEQGFAEDSLKVIEQTTEVKIGGDCLRWPEE